VEVDVSIAISGIGAVSPAGWGIKALRHALAGGEPLPPADLPRPGWNKPLRVRTVPTPQIKPPALAHPRLRRVSAITRYAVVAAVEALGAEAEPERTARLGVILCAMSGCVNYSRRFYDEVLKDPPSASPLVFPETVFNAPASHLATLLGTPAINYTLVGDPGVFLQGVALGADWLMRERVDSCVVIGAEEIDWATADSFRMFSRRVILAEGAGAICLRRARPNDRLQLAAVTNSHLFLKTQKRAEAIRRMRAELPCPDPTHLLCDGTQRAPRFDADETAVWRDWPGARLAPKHVLGEGLVAAAAWQCVAALDALGEGRFPAATVSVVGCNEQAVGAHFVSTG
jgi:3-oxoacyl-(acyl-carrier-protein) synthase